MSELHDLEIHRKRLDELDEKIIMLFAKRFEITRQVGEYKRDHALPARDIAREATQTAHMKKLALQYNLDPSFVESIFRTTFNTVVDNHSKIAQESHTKDKNRTE